jgi:HEAT repeat protein
MKLIPSLATLLTIASLSLASDNAAQVQKHIKNLKSRDAVARQDAAEAIGKIAQIKASAAKPALQPLIETLDDKAANVRAAAATALSRIDEPKEVVPALTRLLKDDKEIVVRTAAASGLGLIGEPARSAVPTLRQAAKDARSEDPMLRQLARAANEALRQINAANRRP